MRTQEQSERADAFLARLRRLAPDLKPEEVIGEFGEVASYHAEDGGRIFSFCLDGLLIDPDRDAQYIPYSEISATGSYGADELELEKSGQMSRELTLTLRDGGMITLPLRASTNRFSERLRIGKLIEQRICLARADQG